MRYLPTLPLKLDLVLQQFLIELLESLVGVLDCNVYKVRMKWSAPFVLDVPLGRYPRQSAPEIVRVCKASQVNSPSTTVSPGLPRWSWVDGRVRIEDVPGLTAGTEYDLSFEVVG